MYVRIGGYFSKPKGMREHRSLGHTAPEGRNFCAHLLSGYFLGSKRFGLPCSMQHTTHNSNRDNPITRNTSILNTVFKLKWDQQGLIENEL